MEKKRKRKRNKKIEITAIRALLTTRKQHRYEVGIVSHHIGVLSKCQNQK